MDIRPFKIQNGHLAILGKNGWDKFCDLCCCKMLGKTQQLKRHIERQHGGKEANFLKYNQQPSYSMYKNWQEYLANPNLELIQREDLNFSKSGRPLKVKQVFKNASKQEGALTTAEESASPRTIPSQIGISKHLNFGGP